MWGRCEAKLYQSRPGNHLSPPTVGAGLIAQKSKDLKVPENVALILLTPYSPELNPAGQIWNRLRKNYFTNKVFDSLDVAIQQAERGLSEMASNREAISSLTNWPWIKSINLIAK